MISRKVLLIIALLPGFFSSSCKDENYTKHVYARRAVQQLGGACDAFYDANNFIPFARGARADTVVDTGDSADPSLMEVLCGLKSEDTPSPPMKDFFHGSDATNEKRDFMVSSASAELLDPWGNPYYVCFDYDHNRQIQVPFSGQILKDVRQIVWSNGPDGKSGTPETNADNICSWK